MQESGDRSQESAERLAERVTRLRALVDVYDATLRVLGLALHRNDIELLDFEQRQVDVAQDAYREVTGDEPLSLAPMLYCEKGLPADAADRIYRLDDPATEEPVL